MPLKEYQIVRLLERKNKENKTYYLALVLFNRDYDSDLIRILITEKQAEALSCYVGDSDYDDISQYIKIEYNSFQKVYQPKITI